MARTILFAAACLLLASARPDAGAEHGTITGRVLLTTKIRGAAMPSTIYQPRVVGTHAVPAIPEIRNVVVSLKNVAFKGELPTTHHEVRQEHEMFVPRVLAVTKGSIVEFPNDDPVFHNVFSLASAATFDLGRYPKGRSKGTLFKKPGVVKVFCHLHSQMSASIVVLDHPYFTTPELDGTFRLENVPPGTYSLAGWHERVGERVVSLTVKAGESTDATLTLPVEDGP